MPRGPKGGGHRPEAHALPPTINGTLTALRFFFTVSLVWA